MEFKKCTKCGAKNETDSDFCGSCGTNIKTVPVIEESTQKASSKKLTQDTLTTCIDCGEKVARNAPACPNCGRPTNASHTTTQATQKHTSPTTPTSAQKPEQGKKLSPALLLGIVFVPYIFSWFTLRDGYSSGVRVRAIGWASFFLLVFLLEIIAPSPTPSPTSSPAQATNTAVSGNACRGPNFSGWDRSNSDFEKLVKEKLNDPSSFEHVETINWKEGDRFIAKMTFRGKNVFGATITQQATAEFDCAGNLLNY